LTKNIAHSFLLLGGMKEVVSKEFASSLCKVINFLGLNTISDFLLKPYLKFFENLNPVHHSNIVLKTLLKFAKLIGADITWL